MVVFSIGNCRGASKTKAWFPYRCICRIGRVCRTKKIHRTDRIHSISYKKLYLSFLLYWAFVREVSIKLYLSYDFFSNELQFQQLLKTQVILILNFTRIHCDYFLITCRAKLLNFLMCLGLGHRSCTLLNLVASFFHSPIFLKTFFHHSVLFFLFSFSLLSYNSSICSSSTVSSRDAIVT